MGSSLGKTAIGVALIVLAAGLPLAGCVVSKTYSPAEDRAAIDGLRRQIQDAENTGDASVFARVAADDVVVMPPKAGLILGRDAATNGMREFFEKSALKIEYSRPVVEVHSDVAIERGLYSQTVTPKGGGEAVASRGTYLWVYRRIPAGGWLMSHAIWN